MYERIQALIGEENLAKLHNARVTVVGLGGVGYTAAEILLRSGITNLKLVDGDTVSVSNLNRQLLSTHSVIGLPKTEAARARLLDIQPQADIQTYAGMFTHDTADDILGDRPDFVLDAIDTIGYKTVLITECLNRGLNIISSLGAGNRMSVSSVRVCDIAQTTGCRFAAAIRKKLRRNGELPRLPVVFSDEVPQKISQPQQSRTDIPHPKSLVGSIATVTITFGTVLADYVIKSILNF